MEIRLPTLAHSSLNNAQSCILGSIKDTYLSVERGIFNRMSRYIVDKNAGVDETHADKILSQYKQRNPDNPQAFSIVEGACFRVLRLLQHAKNSRDLAALSAWHKMELSSGCVCLPVKKNIVDWVAIRLKNHTLNAVEFYPASAYNRIKNVGPFPDWYAIGFNVPKRITAAQHTKTVVSICFNGDCIAQATSNSPHIEPVYEYSAFSKQLEETVVAIRNYEKNATRIGSTVYRGMLQKAEKIVWENADKLVNDFEYLHTFFAHGTSQDARTNYYESIVGFGIVFREMCRAFSYKAVQRQQSSSYFLHFGSLDYCPECGEVDSQHYYSTRTELRCHKHTRLAIKTSDVRVLNAAIEGTGVMLNCK